MRLSAFSLILSRISLIEELRYETKVPLVLSYPGFSLYFTLKILHWRFWGAWTLNRRGREFVWRGASIMVDERAW